MIRNALFAALGAAAILTLAGPASAQPVPKMPFPKIDGLPPELQKELRDFLIQEGAAARLGRLPAGRTRGQMQWGGVRMEKASAQMQTDLGLGDKEGLVVVAVDPNSAGARAGLKAKDVLVKFGDKSVPNDATSFGLLVKDQKSDAPIDLVVVRDGKEETLKAAKMPALVQNLGGNGDGRRFGGGRPGFGGVFVPRIQMNQRGFIDPFQPGAIQNLHVEMIVNGAKIVRSQTNDKFSGEYTKDGLKITVAGKVENGRAKAAEISVTEGKETKKYTSLRDAPVQHRRVIQQLMPSSVNNLMLLPLNPLELPDLLPVVPEIPR